MKTCRTLLLGALLPGAMALAQGAVPAPLMAPDGDPLIEAVRAASDPSVAIEAYAHALAAGTIPPVLLERIYVQHMVDHGAPELADAQARGLIRRGAGDATVRGVVAYNDAARGDVPNAVSNLKLGLTQRPADPFLLRTAGQIVAWYDTQADRSGLSKEDLAGIEWLRAAGKQRQEFADAFRMASDARQPAQTDAAPATPAPTTQGSSAGGASAGNNGNAGTEATSGSTSGSSYSPYSYYNPYYGYAYGSASVIAVRDRDFRPDRFGPGRDPHTSPIRPGNLPGRGAGPDRGGGSPSPRPAQAPAQPQRAPVRVPQAPAARPPSPPGPPHP